jgi:glutamyl-tRNA synthetase
VTRTRLAPSPTGALHLGNARTFLLTWLWARARGAEVVMRMEDLDTPRTKKGAAEEALLDLRWLGLDWDGPVMTQSTRAAAYGAALDRLHAAGRAYPCVCTRLEILAATASAPNEGDEGPTYPGTCRGRYESVQDAERHVGGVAAWRFVVPAGSFTYDDAFLGPVTRDLQRDGGDFVVARKSGEAAYQLAVVVDDAAQGITDVIRGDDLVPSTPRQLLLYDALGLPAPRFAHLPLVRGEDGRRLAKRHGDTRLSSYRARGVRPERVVGLLAAWSGLAERGEVGARELVRGGLEWSKVPRGDVTFRAADDAWLLGR